MVWSLPFRQPLQAIRIVRTPHKRARTAEVRWPDQRNACMRIRTEHGAVKGEVVVLEVLEVTWVEVRVLEVYEVAGVEIVEPGDLSVLLIVFLVILLAVLEVDGAVSMWVICIRT